MRTAAYKVDVASDRRRRENVPRHILYSASSGKTTAHDGQTGGTVFMWSYDSVFYQISTLGFCGAPTENDGVLAHRIKKVEDWIPHMVKLGVDAIYFCPVFESDRHGYDTRDYTKLDVRLGTNEDFKEVCGKLHDNNIKVVLDGVFNHVGRGFFAFQDLLKNRENSPYKDWFTNVNFGWNNNYNDGLSYEGWEGHNELVKLNLRNEEVIRHIFSAVEGCYFCPAMGTIL